MATSHTQTNFHKLRDSPPSTHRSDVELSDFHAPENEPAEAQSLLEQGVISPALLLKKHSPANSSVAGSVIGSPASYIGEPPTRRQVLAWRFRFIVFCGLVIAATALTAVSLSETDRQWFYIDYPSMNVTTQYGWLRYQIVPIGSTIEVMRGEPSYLLEDKNGAIGSVGKAVAVLSLLTCIAAVCLSCSVEHHMRFGRSSCIGRTGIRLVEVACWYVHWHIVHFVISAPAVDSEPLLLDFSLRPR